jgi:hypothetical protein
MTTINNEIVTKVVKQEAPTKREDGLTAEALLLQGRVAQVLVMAVKPVKAAKVQRGIREIMRTVGKREICGSALIAKGVRISPRTASESNELIVQRLPSLLQNDQMKH